MLNGVSDGHRRVIDQFQPYQRRRRAAQDPLATLRTISNRDKHNDVYIAIGTATTPGFRINRPELGDYIEVKLAGKLLPYRLANGHPFFGLTWNPPPLPEPQETKVHLEPINMTPDLGFLSDNRTFFLDDLARAVDRVGEIVQTFAARLKP